MVVVPYFVSMLLSTSSPPFTDASDRDLQFRAIQGDLQHKLDLYRLFEDFGPPVEAFFSNSSQARYLRAERPDLVPVGSPSDYTLGTVFEDNYFRLVLFRSSYLVWVSQFVVCPTTLSF